MKRLLSLGLGGLALGVSLTAAAADHDTQFRVNELPASDPKYLRTWQQLVEDEERLPEWIINLSGTATPMQALEEDDEQYLVGELCEAHDCAHQRLYVAFSWDKAHAYALYVQLPANLPADKAPSRHASYRWLGEPDAGIKQLLDEQLKADPNWY
ncbi:inhibitor of vertebrate lysozyme family protein [Pseudomonas sp. UL073]|uniref:Inhibitor of vertebrate lysozyme family protein n=1 Tax=Zestomonas insulae TaxID=2809017 RepID=A0ABS2IKQ3_9GAMM|nr:inhibitor of vertebrate lysozyme family protein [Pseudomonas insulae]MBM7062572.1 inhibitor of vertebrate lysozyme family protein [Pseudomonas insulae]